MSCTYGCIHYFNACKHVSKHHMHTQLVAFVNSEKIISNKSELTPLSTSDAERSSGTM